jgi:hypothetical protein
MDTQAVHSVVIRKEGSEKVLILIDHLTEAEADKVFKNILFPTLKGQGFEKVQYYRELPIRKSPI